MVIHRRFQAENWRDPLDPSGNDRRMTGNISTWRAANRALIDTASAYVVLATQAMLGSPDWTMDPLRVIEEKTAAGRDGGVYPVDWDRTWWLPTDTTTPTGEQVAPAPAWPGEASWLREVAWQRDGRSAAGAMADTIARQIVEKRRDASGSDVGAHLQARLQSAKIDDVVAALQGLAMAFHVRRFEPSIEMETGKLDPELWGLDALPQSRQPIGMASLDPYRDLAEADFAFMRYMSEYIYSGPVKAYLAGADPFDPDPNEADYHEEIKLVLAGETPRRHPSHLGAGFAAFSRFAKNAERARLSDLIGSIDQFKQDYDAGPRGANWTRVADLLRTRADAIVAAVRAFDTQFNSWRVRRPFSLSDCRTFPEFMEGYSGLFVHYLRSAAQAAPDRRVMLTYPDWFKHQQTVQDLFPHCFDFLNETPREEATPDRQLMAMPIKQYADLVANLSDLIALALCAKAGEYNDVRETAAVNVRAAEDVKVLSAPQRARIVEILVSVPSRLSRTIMSRARKPPNRAR
jgi:hypothetical protein